MSLKGEENSMHAVKYRMLSDVMTSCIESWILMHAAGLADGGGYDLLMGEGG